MNICIIKNVGTANYLILPLVVFVLNSACIADTVYVAPGGDDDGEGTLDDPYATIKHASLMAGLGGRVRLLGGIYEFKGVSEVIRVGGEPGNRMTITSYDENNRAVLKGDPNQPDRAVLGAWASYIDIKNLVLANGGRGISIWNQKEISIIDCDVHDMQQNGIVIGQTATQSEGYKTRDILVRNCNVYRCVLDNKDYPEGTRANGGWSAGVAVLWGKNIRFEKNQIYRNHGEGLIFAYCDSGHGHDNVIWDNFSVNAYFDNAKGIDFQGNFIYNTGDSRFEKGGYSSTGIQVANEAWKKYQSSNTVVQGLRSSDLVIANNIVAGCRNAFTFNADGGTEGAMENVRIFNNTFCRSEKATYSIGRGAHTVEIKNNICLHNSSFEMVATYGQPSGLVWRNNCWYGVGAAWFGDAGVAGHPSDINSNPLLVDYTGYSSHDFKLRASVDSNCEGAGLVLPVAMLDFFGSARFGQSYDIGAHQKSGP